VRMGIGGLVLGAGLVGRRLVGRRGGLSLLCRELLCLGCGVVSEVQVV
jgi:hypothetical protein